MSDGKPADTDLVTYFTYDDRHRPYSKALAMTDPASPETFSRRILLVATGLSPQVVTETLYALAVKRIPSWIPNEIILITTQTGAEHARLSLLSDEPGWFHRLLDDYRLPEISFDPNSILIIPDAQGRPADDIRTPEDNERAADFIANVVRELTADPKTALHVSLTGGRKTMGYYLGYALSLYGRPQDRLSHVLVSPPFESHPEFFYPALQQKIIYSLDKGQSPLDCHQAEITLAEIPFVSLRTGLDQRLLHGQASFSETVEAAKRALLAPELIIDLKGQKIQAAGKIVRLQPADLALLSVFARRALRGDPPVQAPSKGVPERDWAERFLAEYRTIRSGELDDLEATEMALAKGMDGEYFSQRKAKLHRALKKALGAAATPYLISDGNTRPRRYCLELSSETIRFEPLEVQES